MAQRRLLLAHEVGHRQLLIITRSGHRSRPGDCGWRWAEHTALESRHPVCWVGVATSSPYGQPGSFRLEGLRDGKVPMLAPSGELRYSARSRANAAVFSAYATSDTTYAGSRAGAAYHRRPLLWPW